MACHNIYMANEKEFFQRIKDRDSELLIKMVKCVLSAHKRKLNKIDIFDISFKDTSSMVFTMRNSEFTNFLSNCMQDMINVEEYELCAEIKKIAEKKTRVRKNKSVTKE